MPSEPTLYRLLAKLTDGTHTFSAASTRRSKAHGAKPPFGELPAFAPGEVMQGAELLPVWFVTALGPMAPSRNANDWMDAATDVLAYRVTYRITDPVIALGAPPDGHRTSRRTAWHQELTRELRRWG
ncbi:hypothetical protein ACWGJX_42690 [Streptomyces sp. NPDC054775]